MTTYLSVVIKLTRHALLAFKQTDMTKFSLFTYTYRTYFLHIQIESVKYDHVNKIRSNPALLLAVC
jgi:hypothetical protein